VIRVLEVVRLLPRFGLHAAEVAWISTVISATDSRFRVAGPLRSPDPAGTILSDADALDVLSLGRWEVGTSWRISTALHRSRSLATAWRTS